MSANDADTTLVIDGELTVRTAAQRHRELLPRLAGVQCFDLAGVGHADSAGLALLQALRRAAADRNGGPRPPLRGVPDRLRQLCVAHRVELDGN